MVKTCTGSIRNSIMKVKKGPRSFQSNATRPYAVSEEKYNAHTVAPTDIITEFIKPMRGLKLPFVRCWKLSSK
jgi:hypothetical protein